MTPSVKASPELGTTVAVLGLRHPQSDWNLNKKTNINTLSTTGILPGYRTNPAAPAQEWVVLSNPRALANAGERL